MRIAGDVVVLFLIVLAAASAAVLLPPMLARRRLRPLGATVWKAAHHSVQNETVVSVELRQPMSDGSYRVLEQRSVGTVANNAADYDASLADLLDRARERAYLIGLRSSED
jgi:hypothetical protein